MAKDKGGRPTVMTPDVLGKLEMVFSLGGTDTEACFYAGIDHSTLYDYQAKHPEFTERKQMLKQTPILKARQTVVQDIKTPNGARWFLERVKKDEFSTRTETTGKDGADIAITINTTGE